MRPCQRSITVGLETPTPATTRPGASEASVWKPIASSPTGARRHRDDAGPDRDALRGDGDRREQREDVRAGNLPGDDRVVAAALRLACELDELARSGSPSSTGIEIADAHPVTVPRTTGGRRSRNAATPSLWSSVVKSSAVVSIVSASPLPVSRFTNCLPI